jgi:transposase-like protein
MYVNNLRSPALFSSEAIEAIYPHTEVQLCIVHLVRASLKYVPWKDDPK